MISIEKITKCFEDKTALKDISFELNDGSILGIVGNNGAGKSTLLRVLAGIYKVDEGSVKYNDKDVWENKEVKNSIFLIADDIFFPNGNTMASVAKFYRDFYSKFDQKKFNYLSELFKLDKKMLFNRMSKGMKRQAAIVLGLSTNPEYLLLDEVFDGLDPVVRKLVKNLINKDVEERGMTAIISTHSLRELEGVCDKLALLHDNTLVYAGDTEELQTSFFKMQVAFKYEYDSNSFENIEIVDFSKNGSVANIIVKGDREDVTEKISKMNPLLFEIIPLNLEEIFINEMKLAGYSFEFEGEE